MKKTVIFAACAALALSAIPFAACNKKEEVFRSSYEITAAYDEEARTLSGTAEFTFYNSTENEIGTLEFNLWGNAYREGAAYKPISEAYSKKAYYAGESYGGMSVDKVEGCASWEVGGADENILLVSLTKPVYPEEKAVVSISYTLTAAQVNHRTGVTQESVNLGNFYPVLCAYSKEGFISSPYCSCGDPFVSECADYKATLTFPKSYTAAASGTELARSVAGNNVTVEYSLQNARDFALVLYPECKSIKGNADGLEVVAYYCGEEAPQKALDAACSAIEYFNLKFGSYTYPSYTLAFTPLSVSGMEYPALCMIESGLDEEDAIYTAVHETAHQWWYALVGNDQINCAYMDEGLAEYSTLCFFEAHPEYGFTRTGLLGTAIKSYRAYYSVYNQIFGKADTTMNRPLEEFASDYEYINVAYNKSLLMFESVRTAMGDERFFKALSAYFKDNKFKIADQEDMIAHFAALYDVEGLFMSYIDGKVVI